ncbi:MAG: NnrS family protein [Terriglobales bacterium]
MPLTELDATYEETRRYERRMSRLLSVFILTGLAFLLGPGGFLGVGNLLAISIEQRAAAVLPLWIQTHGHVILYGWVGSFILGIGLHSLTRRHHTRVNFKVAWTCWALWTSGVALRWYAGMHTWHWRLLLPLSAALELAAFGIFQSIVFRAHRRLPDQPSEPLPGWVLLVLTGALGFGLTLIVNLAAAIHAAGWSPSAAFTLPWDHRMVELMTWAFLAPFVFGFSTRWLPVFAGLRPSRDWVPHTLVPLLAAGAIAVLAGAWMPAAFLWAAAAAVAITGLHLFTPAVAKAKTQGVHPTFPLFFRFAYAWLAIAAALGLWSAFSPANAGLSGASRHAFTVGFIATMVLTIGQRVLPAFSGMKLLYSPLLMFLSLALVEVGCFFRVFGELLAYPGWWHAAWAWLPVSAGLEGLGFVLFALNLICTLARRPAHLQHTPAAV